MIRRFIERMTAWALRRGLTEDEMLSALRASFPWRDSRWRVAVLMGAERHNRGRR